MLQQSDVDILLATLLASQESGAVRRGHVQSEVKIYDFARPDNMPSEIVRVLERLNTSFARALSTMFTATLGESVQVEQLSAEQMTFRQFCHSIPEVTTLGTFSINQSEQLSLFEVNSHLAWYLVDRGLGGYGEILEAPREFTAIEKGLLEDFFRRMLRELSKAWESISPLNFLLKEIISNPGGGHLAQLDDRMVVCSFGITLERLTGMSYYAIPVSCLDFDRLLSGMRNNLTENRELTPEQESERLQRGIKRAPVRIHACLPDTPLHLGEMAHLSVGDIIQIDSKVDDPFEIRVGAETKFLARLVSQGESVAIEILDEVVEENYE